MAVLSVLKGLGNSSVKLKCFLESTRKYVLQNNKLISKNFTRNMSDHGPKTMYITPSRFQYSKFKDDLHFYFTLGVVPVGLLILYCNIFIGHAELAEIPEGYEPKHWEYYRHPITRFIEKHFHRSIEENYEKTLHVLNEMQEQAEWSLLTKKVKKLQQERNDYQGWFYVPNTQGKYFRRARKQADELEAKIGYR